MESTWEPYDLPVLRAIVQRSDDTGQGFDPGVVSMDTGIDLREVRKAVLRLASESPPFFESHANASGEIWLVGNPTGHARRTVGQWPTPETMADRLIASFQQAAEAETDPEKKSRLRRIAEGLGGIGREILVKATTQALTDGLSR